MEGLDLWPAAAAAAAATTATTTAAATTFAAIDPKQLYPRNSRPFE